MKPLTITDAADMLHRAARALRCGDLSIHEQVTLATKCDNAAFALRHELEQDVPRVPVEAQS